MSSVLCPACMDQWSNHTLRQRRACLKEIDEQGLEVDLASLPRVAPRKLTIPPKVLEGRRRAVTAVRNGRTPDPDDVVQRREYARLRRTQLTDDEKQLESLPTKRAKAVRRARTSAAEVARRRRHQAGPTGVSLCGRGTVSDDPDCQVCERISLTAGVITTRLHLDRDGRALCRHAGSANLAPNLDAVDCGTCLRLLDRELNPRPSKRNVAARHLDVGGRSLCGLADIGLTTDLTVVDCRQCLRYHKSRNRPAPKILGRIRTEARQKVLADHADELQAAYEAALAAAGVDIENLAPDKQRLSPI